MQQLLFIIFHDKAGKESTAAFQTVLNSYNLLRKHFFKLREKNDIPEDNFENNDKGQV